MASEGFLSRWSRRKRGEAAEEPVADAPVVGAPVADAAAAPQPAAEAAADPVLDLSDLPSIESLTIESPVTAFLRPGVPAALRNAALRRAWSLDPAIRDFVGPADYAWDFNAPDGVPGFALELGGDIRKLLAQAIGRTAPEDAVQGGGPPEADQAPADGPADEAPGEPGTESRLLLAGAQEAEPAMEDPPGPSRRRHGTALPS